MASNAATAVYRFVIDDVIANVRRDFEDMGVDEAIMVELQMSWENKIAQSRVTAFQTESAAAVESYPLEETNYDHIPAASTARAAGTVTAPAPIAAPATTTPTPAAKSAASAQRATQPAANTPALPGRSTTTTTANNTNNRIPQTDGASDDTPVLEFMNRAELDAFVEKKLQAIQDKGTDQACSEDMSFEFTMSDKVARKARRSAGGLGPLQDLVTIRQVDGGDDEQDDTELGSDLDDSEDDMDEELDNIGLCQYDKVSRTKNKWKFVLKDGILLINGRDYLFHKANGDCDFDR
ncbi:hypothetical protein BG004_004413 [Podila humilis]|nr:hypothetical protein BG004_004413 [Podila humilis]